MKCPTQNEETAGVLLEYCSGRLKGQALQGLARHVAVCEACGEFVAGQQKVLALLDAWESAPIGQAFDRRVFERIDAYERQSLWHRIVEAAHQLMQRPIVPVVAAACVVLVATAVVELRPVQTQHQEKQLTGAAVERVDFEQVERTLEDLEMLREFDTSQLAETSQKRPSL